MVAVDKCIKTKQNKNLENQRAKQRKYIRGI
jgi:hypothetical protein